MHKELILFSSVIWIVSIDRCLAFNIRIRNKDAENTFAFGLIRILVQFSSAEQKFRDTSAIHSI